MVISDGLTREDVLKYMDVHIGKEIEKRYQASGIKLAEFAKRLNSSTRNIYSIFERKDITTAQLKKISQILNYDFFQLFQKPPATDGQVKPDTTKVTVLVELDGTEPTKEKWFMKLNAINSAVNK